MAAKSIQIKTSKSKRIRAANKFLSNISLDGSVLKDNTKKETAKNKKLRLTLDKDDEDLLSNPTFLDPSLLQRPKLLTSFSTTNAIEDEENLDPSGSASSTTTYRKDSTSVEHHYYRSSSLRESTFLHNNLTITSSKSLLKYESHLRGKRIFLCSGHHIPFAVYSTLNYSQEEHGDSSDKNTNRLRRMSGEHGCDLYGIKGVDIGPLDKPVSLGHLLVPACGLSPRSGLSQRKNLPPGLTSQEPIISFSSSCLSPRGDHFMTSHMEQTSSFVDYDPLLLDDPELRTGCHRKVLRLSSFMVSIIEYVKPLNLKRDLNDQFRDKFPNMEITLSKLRSLKHDILRLSNECALDYSTVAYTFVYFEKLVLGEKINKTNRKLVAGSCLLLAAKFNSDLKKDSVKHLIVIICDSFHVNVDDLFLFEIQVLVALEFNLHLPSVHLLPHMKRLEFEATVFVSL